MRIEDKVSLGKYGESEPKQIVNESETREVEILTDLGVTSLQCVMPAKKCNAIQSSTEAS